MQHVHWESVDYGVIEKTEEACENKLILNESSLHGLNGAVQAVPMTVVDTTAHPAILGSPAARLRSSSGRRIDPHRPLSRMGRGSGGAGDRYSVIF